MTCQTTLVPPAEELDIPALRARYAAEREKRIRRDGDAQYAPSSDRLTQDTYAHDPFTPVTPRDAISTDIEVAVLGGGWTGILASYHLTKAGVTDFRVIDHAGNFGGTWYWNRYPGIQCDNDAYCYLALLEETGFLPSKKFSDGKEIYDYMQQIADTFGFRDKGLFHTLVTSMNWDEGIQRWRIATNRGDEIRARFVIMAGGVLSTPKFPRVNGLETFKGKMFHTSRWDFDYTGGEWGNPVLSKLAGKRVAILGTGATAIQAVPYLGQYAEQLYVLQRTPSSVDNRPNPPTDMEWARTLEPGWQLKRQANFMRASNEIIVPGEGDQICDIWTEINRNIDAELEAEGRPPFDIADYMARRDRMDFQVMERMRRRVADIVKDPDTAEALKPYYNFMCKRPLSNDDYYETFNRSNVTLFDVSATQGLAAMTEKGFVVDGAEYEVDCIIFASGFEVTSDLRKRWGIDDVVGRRGVSIYDYWADGPRTFHGAMAHNFPNMFFTGYVQNGLNGTTTLMFGSQGQHAAHIISDTLAKGMVVAEPTAEAEKAYVEEFNAKALDLQFILDRCPPSYFTNEGEKEAKWFLFRGWGPGWDDWVRKLEDWRGAGDLEGLKLDPAV